MEDRKFSSSVLRGVDITEVYSPQRVVEVCHKYKLIKGDSFDLRTGFDLSDPAVQQSTEDHLFRSPIHHDTSSSLDVVFLMMSDPR